MESNYDIAVIGAGVLGVFHAYHAASRGLRVLLIERAPWPAEASIRNFGTLVPSAMVPGEWHRRALESVALWRELATQVPLPLNGNGTQWLATTPLERAVLEEYAAVGPSRGYECQLLSAEESLNANPAINPDIVRASIICSNDARVESRRVFTAMIPYLQSRGCTYLPNTVVTNVKANARGVALRTAAGDEFTADHAFICSGNDLRTLYPEQMAAAKLKLCKLLMYKTAPQRSTLMPITIASGLSMRWYAAFQMAPSWKRLELEEPISNEIKQWRVHVLMVQDADGGIIVGDSHEYSSPGVGAGFDDRLDMQVENLITEQARRIANLDNWNIAHRWAGVYSLHPDKPLYRESIDGRVHLITGIAGKGMTTGPAVARESLEAALGVHAVLANSLA